MRCIFRLLIHLVRIHSESVANDFTRFAKMLDLSAAKRELSGKECYGYTRRTNDQ